jgi:hypothetical protein
MLSPPAGGTDRCRGSPARAAGPKFTLPWCVEIARFFRTRGKTGGGANGSKPVTDSGTGAPNATISIAFPRALW